MVWLAFLIEFKLNEPAANSVCEANPQGDVSERAQWAIQRGKRSGSNTASGKRDVAPPEPMLQQGVGSSRAGGTNEFNRKQPHMRR